MINTIIFDIGNVLTTFGWQEFFINKGFDDITFEKISKATVGSKSWVEYDRGLLTDEQVLEEFVKNDPSIEKELRESLENIKGMVIRRDYAIPWIKDLKNKGCKVLYLSNFSHKCHVECKDALDFLPYTDGGILSYQDNVVKPDREIYQLIIKRYDLNPEECVFLDDTEANLPPAESFGMRTILFKTQEQAIEELRNMGIK